MKIKNEKGLSTTDIKNFLENEGIIVKNNPFNKKIISFKKDHIPYTIKTTKNTIHLTPSAPIFIRIAALILVGLLFYFLFSNNLLPLGGIIGGAIIGGLIGASIFLVDAIYISATGKKHLVNEMADEIQSI